MYHQFIITSFVVFILLFCNKFVDTHVLAETSGILEGHLAVVGEVQGEARSVGVGHGGVGHQADALHVVIDGALLLLVVNVA